MDWMLSPTEMVMYITRAEDEVPLFSKEVRIANQIMMAQARKLMEYIKANSKPEHWYGAGWDGLIDKGITDYFIDAEILQTLCKELGLEE